MRKAVAEVMRLDEMARSERHFTSGLLMHLLLHEGLRGVDAFLDLLVERGVISGRPVPSAADDARTQVIAEFASRRDLTAGGANVDLGAPGDVIDVVVVVGDTLIALEAKFFTRPTPQDVRKQLAAQRGALAPVLRDPRFGISRTLQVYLEQGRSLDTSTIGADAILSWEDLRGLSARLLGERAYVTMQLTHAVRRCEEELRPNRPGETLWAGTLNFDQMTRICAEQGSRVLVGFSGGERRLRLDELERLRARAWKWDRAESVLNARKDRSNWIPGDRMLTILRGLGWSDAG
jgi:hypothetical protein